MAIKYITKNKNLINQIKEFINNWDDISPNIKIKTSGSTGKPKTIELKKTNMIFSAKMTGDFFNLKEGETILLNLSPKTIGGAMIIVRSIVLKLNLIVVDINSNPLENLNELVDFSAMVPSQVKVSIDNYPQKFNYIKNLIIGGGPISKKLKKEIKKLGCNCYHTFGMTETISHIALKNLKNESFFKILNGVKINIVDNCLEITAPKLGCNKLLTNDIIELKSNKSFKWIGRSDLAINSGGIKIIPSIIEGKLIDIINSSFFCYGIPDVKLGQKHILIIENDENMKINKSDFKTLDRKQIPKEIYFLKKFIYTSSGKINRIESYNLIRRNKIQGKEI